MVSDRGESRSSLLLAGVVLTIVLASYLLYLHAHKGWLEGARQFFGWILGPEISYTPIPLEGLSYAIIGALQMLALGALLTHLLLPDEEDLWVRWLTMFGVGTGSTAIITAILGLLQILYNLWLNLAVLAAIFALVALSYRKWGKEWLARFAKYWKIPHLTINYKALAPTIGIGVIVFFIFYHAVLTPIDHFDALIYHAGMAKVMFHYHGIPLIAGPSPGIEMSANYPPLHPALGAFFFTHMGTTVADLPLRAMPALFGALTLLATYRLGRFHLKNGARFLPPIVLAVTPLFILYSIHPLNNMMAAFYLALTALHMILFRATHRRIYLMISGLFLGLALSTTYLSLHFAPAFMLLTLPYLKKGIRRWAEVAVAFLAGAVLTGSFWYLRNLVVLGNPIWPFAHSLFGGQFIDPLMLDRALQSIQGVGTYVTFGKGPDILDWFHFISLGRPGFPGLSILTLLGAVCILASEEKDARLVFPVLTFVPLAMMLCSFVFFPRYLVLILPFASLLSSQILSCMFSLGQKIVRLLGTVVLIAMLIYPGVVAAASGKMYHDVAAWDPPHDFLWYLRNPGVDPLTAMKRAEGERVEAWSWLNANLKPDERVATYESRIYYIKDGRIHHFFFLDGWEARPLFEMTEPEQMIEYLEGSGVRYIFILGIVSVGFEALPLAQFLGSPYFPLIYQRADARIYNVGPLPDPILDGEIPAQINYDGWTEIRQVEGRPARFVIEGDVRPRLFVATPNIVVVNLTYLDKGTGSLMVNLYNPYTEEWLHGLATIDKTGTGRWKSFAFIVPRDPDRHFAELGLYASGTDFAISRIAVAELDLAGRFSYLTPTGTISNATEPSSLMVYLPIMRGGERVIVDTNSYGKAVSVEIFEGIIQPPEITRWWEKHRMVARSPELPVFGVENPSLSWEAEPGIYTLVIVLWDEYEPDMKVDLSIAIGGGR